ncbi:MAG: pirin family protein [Thermonemataceae bacterium]|nr:pirin family protein [Thermonemataceae bacterium]
MKKIFYPSAERGKGSYGWLETFYSFSFSHYYNPQKIHFGALRVLNDDTVAGGTGFSTHPHDNMEIVTIVLEGALAHQDSTGRGEVIRANEVQIMSAGKGIYHSEKNADSHKPVKLLQIWVFPKEKNIEPRYEQRLFEPTTFKNQLVTVVAPDKPEALWINQDAFFVLGNLEKGFQTSYQPQKSQNGVYAFVIEGDVLVGGEKLQKRDALGVWELENLEIEALTETKLLLIDIPMQA